MCFKHTWDNIYVYLLILLRLPSLSEKQRMYADMLIDKYTTIMKQHPETMDNIKLLPTEETENPIEDMPVHTQIIDITID